MTDLTAGARRTTVSGLSDAVHQSSLLSPTGLLERLFTLAFRGLVYPQIWEDPVVDMQALDIRPTDHVVAIASGGCNVMSYLTADPARVTAIDLNHAHVALNKLKIAAARRLQNHAQFADFFVRANLASNVALFDELIAPALDGTTLQYWNGRDLLGRRRINAFARGFYKTGLLGHFIGAGHLFARLLGVNIRALLAARDITEQRQIFDTQIAPAFSHKIMRAVLNSPTSLYGLGIPPAQYKALAEDGDGDIAQVMRHRFEKLACDFPLKDNYFAWQGFARGYDPDPQGSRPPYLEEQNFELVRNRVSRIDVRHISMTEFLSRNGEGSLDCFVLLDAQDWMNDQQLSDLWTQIDRTASTGARVIFRTAADERLLPGRIPDRIRANWTYEEARSRELHARDRSSIYGAFHLYRKDA